MPYKDKETRRAHDRIYRSKDYWREYYAQHKEQRKIAGQVYYQAHKEEIKQRSKKHQAEHYTEHLEYKKKWRQKEKLQVLTHYSTGSVPQCAKCGIEDIDVLCIDHIQGFGKRHRKKILLEERMHLYRWLVKHHYPDGFQVLCANCNMKKRVENREVGRRKYGNKRKEMPSSLLDSG